MNNKKEKLIKSQLLKIGKIILRITASIYKRGKSSKVHRRFQTVCVAMQNIEKAAIIDVPVILMYRLEYPQVEH